MYTKTNPDITHEPTHTPITHISTRTPHLSVGLTISLSLAALAVKLPSLLHKPPRSSTASGPKSGSENTGSPLNDAFPAISASSVATETTVPPLLGLKTSLAPSFENNLLLSVDDDSSSTVCRDSVFAHGGVDCGSEGGLEILCGRGAACEGMSLLERRRVLLSGEFRCSTSRTELRRSSSSLATGFLGQGMLALRYWTGEPGWWR